MPTRTDIIRSKCIADTLWATRYFFYAENARRFNVGEHHKRIAAALDRVFSGECTRLIINCPPRYSKTEMLKAFVKKGLAINPASKYIMLSYSANLALDNSERIKDAVASEWYQELFPWVHIKRDSHAKQKWYTTDGGGVYAASSDGQVTGFGAGLVREETPDDLMPTPQLPTLNSPLPSTLNAQHSTEDQLSTLNRAKPAQRSTNPWGGAIIIDDPLKPLDASSPVRRQKVNDQFENTIRSRVNDRSTPIIIIMQRLHKQDLCGYLLDLEPTEWEVLSLPALSVDSEGRETALYPFKHTVAELHKIKAANRFTFETQYQQNPQAINERLWLFAFDRAKHTAHVAYDPATPLVLSFDFNRNPMTCTLFQHINGQARGIDCIRLENATTRMVCEEIDRRYGQYHPFYLVTGDCAGRNATTLSLLNNYDVVKAYFGLSRSQMQYSGANPRLADSRYFINSLFEQYDIVFDAERCQPAIFDFENVLSDDENRPVKTTRDNIAQQADFLDNVRYYFHRYYKQLQPTY